MQRLRDRLPPPNSLVAFETAARHLSFTRAAKELRVTQAAISRQIRLLEDHLGVILFSRKHRALDLTEWGERLQRAVSIGLGHIAQVADEIRRAQNTSDVVVSSSVTFASYWLMARIAKYRAMFPEADIHLVASARMRDFAASGVDLAIRYGRGTWPGMDAHFLFGNEIFPVCAPSYLGRHRRLDRLSDLMSATLLHLDQYDRNWVTWPAWLAEFGFTRPPSGPSLSFDNYMVLIHAAIRGEGVALCGGRLAEDLIARGELTRPFEAALKSEFSFYLLEPRDQPPRRPVRHFRDWLLAETGHPSSGNPCADQAG